ncbi:MAG TPA: helix-turn-helix transcriptional regulator [Nostocaceae cyanobacterium]|nr:helix-turn-helix transcriptional regulator [Nostocaceae cyanobacterium]
MKLEDIYKFFEDPPPLYLRQEVAVCYILYALLQRDSYGGELIEHLEIEYPRYRMSDTVFYCAINFLEAQEAVIGYWQKNDGRGRPRRMYQVCPHWQAQAEKLAYLWQQYIQKK